MWKFLRILLFVPVLVSLSIRMAITELRNRWRRRRSMRASSS